MEPGDGAGQVGFELTKDRLCEGDCRIEFTELDEGRCYTINMRDHGLQPLLNDPPAIWSVQSVALRGDSDFQPSFDIGVPSFPKQKVMTLPELQGAVRERLPDEGPEVTVAALRQLCDSSIEDAIRAIREGRTGFDHFHYGFILRSRSHGETGDVSDIIIESPLLNRVRHHMYSPPSQSSPDAKRITTHNRLRFFALRSLLLNEASREEILALFPQFTELDSKAREFLNNVQHYVLEHSRRRASRPEKQSAGASPPAAPHRSSVACLGDEVLRAVYREFPNFNGFERGVAEATIRGYVHDAQNAMFVLAAIGLA